MNLNAVNNNGAMNNNNAAMNNGINNNNAAMNNGMNNNNAGMNGDMNNNNGDDGNVTVVVDTRRVGANATNDQNNITINLQSAEQQN